MSSTQLTENTVEAAELYSPLNTKVVKFPTLNEAEFYEAYLTLDNLTKDVKDRLGAGALLMLPVFLAKPLDFTIIFDNKKKSDKPGESRLVLLGREAKLSPSYTYVIMKELRDKGFISMDEDGIVIFNKELTELRKGVKASITKYAAMRFEYIFTAKVVEDEVKNESSLPKSSR